MTSSLRPRRDTPNKKMGELAERLLDGYVEKQAQYLGVLEQEVNVDTVQKRSVMLSALDSARNSGSLKWGSSSASVLICVSAYNIKIKQTSSRTCLMTLPLESIAVMSYVQDSPDHFLLLLSSDPNGPADDELKCHVFNCAQRTIAEDVCDNLDHAYTLLSSKENIRTLKRGKSERQPITTYAPPIQTGEKKEVVLESAVQVYMQKLNSVMSYQEIREFGSLVSAYRSELPVDEFCSQLQELYGESRRQLLKGMILFIPEEDRVQFVKFIKSLNLPPES